MLSTKQAVCGAIVMGWVMALCACSTPKTSGDMLAIGLMHAKLTAKAKGVDVDSAKIRYTSTNAEWESYWTGISAHNPTPEQQGWQDKIHTLYAYYFLDPDKPDDALWVFVERTNPEEVVGTFSARYTASGAFDDVNSGRAKEK